MSQEHIELVRRGIGSVEAFWAMLDEYVVWDLRAYPIVDLDPIYIGRDAVIEGSRHYWGTWNEYRLEAEELIDAGSSVVVSVHERMRGKGSGVPFDRHWAQVWTFHRGRIIRWELFQDRAAALEAAGIEESATSQNHLEVVREAVVAMNRRDVDAFVACLHPDVDWVESGDVFPGLRGIYSGRADVRKWAEEGVLEPWESFHIEIEEITEASDGRVFAGFLLSARGRASGLETELRFWQVFWFADGKIAKRQVFWNRDEALEASSR